ncbi:MAG: hypothetical protein K2H43_03670, partial [Clostridia bacterium]|nr:hypothetical protein [Clostridia bacterium]
MTFQIIMIVLTVLAALGCPIALGIFAPSLAGGIAIAAIGAAWLIGCIAANSISARRFRRKILCTPAETHKNRAVENAAKIRLDPIAAQKDIRKRLVIGTLYSVSLLIAEFL